GGRADLSFIEYDPKTGNKLPRIDPKTGKPVIDPKSQINSKTGKFDPTMKGTPFDKNNTNREVAQREMEILDVMTANRDKACWAAAQGKEYKVDDSNTPGFVEINTNKPGPLPGLKHKFLGGDEAISKMKLGKNLKINLFASEEKFPELANPVQM